MALTPENRPHARETGHKPRALVVYNQLEVVNSHASPDDQWLGLARTAVGEGYVPYYHKFRRTERLKRAEGKTVGNDLFGKYAGEASHLMYDDSYGQGGRSETICVFDKSEKNGKHLAGTGRLVFGEEYPTEVMRPLELIELVEPQTGWEEVLQGRTLDKVAELGRIVVPKAYRGIIEKDGEEKDQTQLIAHHLIDADNGVVDVAQAHDREIVLMVAQRKFAQHAEGTKLDFGEGIPIELLPAAKRVVKKVFPGYWNDKVDPPKLYVAQVPPKPTE